MGQQCPSHVQRDSIRPVKLYLGKCVSVSNPLVHCLDSFLPALPTCHLTSAVNSEVRVLYSSGFLFISAQGKRERLCISDTVIDLLLWSLFRQLASSGEGDSWWRLFIASKWRVTGWVFLEFIYIFLIWASGKFLNHFGLWYLHPGGSSNTYLPPSREDRVLIWSGAVLNWSSCEIPRASLPSLVKGQGQGSSSATTPSECWCSWGQGAGFKSHQGQLAQRTQRKPISLALASHFIFSQLWWVLLSHLHSDQFPLKLS